MAHDDVFCIVEGGTVTNTIVLDADNADMVNHFRGLGYQDLVDVTTLDPRPGIGWRWTGLGQPLVAPPSLDIEQDPQGATTVTYNDELLHDGADVEFDIGGNKTTVPMSGGKAATNIPPVTEDTVVNVGAVSATITPP